MKQTSTRRIGIDYKTREFVVFDETKNSVYHGHVRSWKNLHPDMQNALTRAGMVNRNGKILIDGEKNEICAPKVFSTHARRRYARIADVNVICEALVSIAFGSPDWRWAQDTCLSFLRNENPALRRLAATCLGHIARIHGQLDKEAVVPALRECLQDPEIVGKVEDALDDIRLFVS
ncbi:HEAT repeat domain-containing protein [Achromobacter xylosoxidans]|uniref:HEAT repeat domain-containing protein n=1 Tax=Alcaligenes xylosoxydans xylosoxydans TaxID=85698 RepID=UPI0010419D8E|nr:HEAT repeat domain-containing protein [Achromobacter xylosoxidans]